MALGLQILLIKSFFCLLKVFKILNEKVCPIDSIKIDAETVTKRLTLLRQVAA